MILKNKILMPWQATLATWPILTKLYDITPIDYIQYLFNIDHIEIKNATTFATKDRNAQYGRFSGPRLENKNEILRTKSEYSEEESHLEIIIKS